MIHPQESDFAAGLSLCLLVVVLVTTKDQILTLCPVLTIKCSICRGEARVSNIVPDLHTPLKIKALTIFVVYVL